MDIREIYWHLLQEASRSGLKRSRHETPEEYSKRLKPILPDSHEQLTRLTDMYIGVRYGESGLPEEKTDSANSLWWKLRSILRGFRGE
jgi:hypothetical protein